MLQAVQAIYPDMKVDAMLAVAQDQVEAELNQTGLPAIEPVYWLVVSDETGTACSSIDPPDDDPTNALHGLYRGDPGIEGVALLRLGQEGGKRLVLAYVLVRHPKDSDVRAADVSEVGSGGLRIGEWTSTV